MNSKLTEFHFELTYAIKVTDEKSNKLNLKRAHEIKLKSQKQQQQQQQQD